MITGQATLTRLRKFIPRFSRIRPTASASITIRASAQR
ncbi:hypothetical protein KKC1_33340, partial [Calderihabitans maritimus]